MTAVAVHPMHLGASLGHATLTLCAATLAALPAVLSPSAPTSLSPLLPQVAAALYVVSSALFISAWRVSPPLDSAAAAGTAGAAAAAAAARQTLTFDEWPPRGGAAAPASIVLYRAVAAFAPTLFLSALAVHTPAALRFYLAYIMLDYAAVWCGFYATLRYLTSVAKPAKRPSSSRRASRYGEALAVLNGTERGSAPLYTAMTEVLPALTHALWCAQNAAVYLKAGAAHFAAANDVFAKAAALMHLSVVNVPFANALARAGLVAHVSWNLARLIIACAYLVEDLDFARGSDGEPATAAARAPPPSPSSSTGAADAGERASVRRRRRRAAE